MKNFNHPVLLPDTSCLQIHGPDARSFLQSQLSIDVIKLKQGSSRLGAYCEPKGRVISTLILALIDERFYMLIPDVLKEKVLSTLLRYRFRAKVEFESPINSAVHGCYPETADVRATHTKQQVYIAHPMDSQRAYLLQPVNEAIESFDEDKLRDWMLADIHSGMVWLDQRTTVQHLPQSLGLVDNNAVDFDKGCYPGQEIIARLKYLGQPKHTLRRFETALDCIDIPLANLLRDESGKRQGQHLNCVCYKHSVTGLTVVSRTAIDAGKTLYLVDDTGGQLGDTIKIIRL